MKHLYLTALVLIVLLTQWGSSLHDYHPHDSVDTCDYCLSAHALDHVIADAVQNIFVSSSFQLPPEQIWLTFTEKHLPLYPVRGPPRFI